VWMAEKVLNRMEDMGLQPDAFAMSQLIKACAYAGDIRVALDVLKRMEEKQLPIDELTMTSMLETCAHAGDMTLCLEMLEKSQKLGVPPTVKMVNCMIHACAEGADKRRGMKMALEVVDKMEGMGLAPDLITMTNAINACRKVNDATRAVELLDKTEQLGLSLDVWIMRSTIQACTNANDVTLAIQVLERMHGLGLVLNDGSLNQAITSMINICATKNEAKQALEVASKAEEFGLDITVIQLNAVLKAFCRWPFCCGFSYEEGVKEQDAFIARMRTRGLVPNERTYFELLVGCDKLPPAIKGTRAPVVFDALIADGVDPNSPKLLRLLRGCLGDEQYEAYCMAHVEEIQSRFIHSEATQARTSARGSDGDWNGRQRTNADWRGQQRRDTKRSRSRSRERDGVGRFADDGGWRKEEDWRLQEEDMRTKAARWR